MHIAVSFKKKCISHVVLLFYACRAKLYFLIVLTYTHMSICYICHCFATGYVVLQNTDVLPSGSVAFVYAVLLDALVPYLANFQSKVRIIITAKCKSANDAYCMVPHH